MLNCPFFQIIPNKHTCRVLIIIFSVHLHFDQMLAVSLELIKLVFISTILDACHHFQIYF